MTSPSKTNQPKPVRQSEDGVKMSSLLACVHVVFSEVLFFSTKYSKGESADFLP